MNKQKKPSRWQQVVRGSRLWLFAIGLTLTLTVILSFNMKAGDDLMVEVMCRDRQTLATFLRENRVNDVEVFPSNPT